MEKEKSYNDIDRKIKEEEIKRLTDLDNDSPLEPRKGILTDDEILKYAGDSKAASEIRLKRGVGTLSDKKSIYEEPLDTDLIEKKFFSNSITYDKFLSVITTSRTAFYNELSEMFSIIETTTENNEKINTELLTKNANLKRIIEKLDELTNELVINLNTSNDEDDEEIKILLEDMESLINSVKDYK